MLSSIQVQKAERFLQFHHDDEILVLLNSWDVGSSRLIEASGYKAIATTSMGMAASLGYPDCQVMQLSEVIAPAATSKSPTCGRVKLLHPVVDGTAGC